MRDNSISETSQHQHIEITWQCREGLRARKKSLDDGPGNATGERRSSQNAPPFDLDARDGDTVPCNDGGRAHLATDCDTQIEHMLAPTASI
jgi:hypothetical protein